MKQCINCGKEIANPSGVEDVVQTPKFCKDCAGKLAETFFDHTRQTRNSTTGAPSKPMPKEINNGKIISWNPETKSGKTHSQINKQMNEK